MAGALAGGTSHKVWWHAFAARPTSARNSYHSHEIQLAPWQRRPTYTHLRRSAVSINFDSWTMTTLAAQAPPDSPDGVWNATSQSLGGPFNQSCRRHAAGREAAPTGLLTHSAANTIGRTGATLILTTLTTPPSRPARLRYGSSGTNVETKLTLRPKMSAARSRRGVSPSRVGSQTVVLRRRQHLHRRHHGDGRHLALGSGCQPGRDRRLTATVATSTSTATAIQTVGSLSGSGRTVALHRQPSLSIKHNTIYAGTVSGRMRAHLDP